MSCRLAELSQLGVTRNVDVSLPTDAPSLVRDLQQRLAHRRGQNPLDQPFVTSDLRQNGSPSTNLALIRPVM